WLNKSGDGIEPHIDLRIVKVSNFIEHLAQRAGPLTDSNHVDRELRDPAGRFETVGERTPFTNTYQNARTGESESAIGDRLTRYLDRLREGYAAGQQSREAPGQLGDGHLANGLACD